MGLIQTAKAPFVSLSLSVLRLEHFPPEIASPIMMLQHTWRLFSKTWIPTPGNVPAHHCGSIGGGAFPKWITIVSSAQHNLAFYHTDQPMSVWDPPLQSNQTSIFWTEANYINRKVPKELQQSSQNVQMFYSKQHIFLLTNLTTFITTMTTTRSTMNGPLRLLWPPTTATL